MQEGWGWEGYKKKVVGISETLLWSDSDFLRQGQAKLLARDSRPDGWEIYKPVADG